jgi:hypothetical protein
MKEYNSIPRYLDDASLHGEYVVAFNKLDGQNFRVKYTPKGLTKKQFTTFGSRTQLVDETSEQFGDTVRFFKRNYESPLRDIIVNNSGKHGIFNGAEEITLFLSGTENTALLVSKTPLTRTGCTCAFSTCLSRRKVL